MFGRFTVNVPEPVIGEPVTVKFVEVNPTLETVPVVDAIVTLTLSLPASSAAVRVTPEPCIKFTVFLVPIKVPALEISTF